MKKLLTLLSFGLLTLIVSSCCNFQPQEGDIRVPLGPEDIALHRSQSAEVTLLASCGGRRSKSSAAGAIVEIHPETLSSRIVYQGSQESPFFPQGLSVTGDKLFVINHATQDRSEVLELSRNRQGDFRLTDNLAFEALDRLSKGTPNDLAVLPNGDILLTSPHPLSSQCDRILRYRRSTGTWEDFDSSPKGRFPNGIWVHEDYVYVSFTMSKNVYRYQWSHQSPKKTEKPVFKNLKGADNFGAIAGEPKKVLLTSHRSLGAFLLSKRFPRLCAPVHIWELDLELEDSKEVLPAPKSQFRVNSGSVAVNAGNDLFIGQVYGPSVVRVPENGFATAR